MFRAHTPPLGAGENLVCALILLGGSTSFGDLEMNAEVIKVARPNFNRRDLPGCAHPRRGGRTDAANGRGRSAAHVHRCHQHGNQQIGSTHGRGLARNLSNIFKSVERAVGTGEFALQVCGDEQKKSSVPPKMIAELTWC